MRRLKKILAKISNSSVRYEGGVRRWLTQLSINTVNRNSLRSMQQSKQVDFLKINKQKIHFIFILYPAKHAVPYTESEFLVIF